LILIEMANMNAFVSGTDRQQQIAQLVERQQRIRVADLCELFTISEATARRDLETLALHGKVERVHGGAIAIHNAPPELPILEREGDENEAKRRIGQAASELIQDGEAIYLGSGTTVLELTRILRVRKGLTLITNSLPVLNLLSGTENTIVCLGGMLRPTELSFIGYITEQALAEVRADKVIIGARAISLEHGLTNDYLPETLTDRAILRAGQEVIVLADHTKFGRVATAMLMPVESVNTIITDKMTDKDFIEDLEERGIRVIIG
jgi:DeoR/GlpR family transcriptional regulator of sugar metabolism